MPTPFSRPLRRRTKRLKSIESLEPRWLRAGFQQNPFNPLDVDDNGSVVAQDALLVINAINLVTRQSDASDLLQDTTPASNNYRDVNGDQDLSPLDALLVINHLNRARAAVPALVVSLDRDSDPDGNGYVLVEQVHLNGQTTPNARVRILQSGKPQRIIDADAQGKFQFELTLARGENEIRIDSKNESHDCTSIQRVLRLSDTALNVNASMLNLVRDWTTVSNDPFPNRIVTSQPPMVARNLAMVHVAMYDALANIEGNERPFQVVLEAPAGSISEVAVAAAAHRVATALYSQLDEVALLDASLAETLALYPDSEAKTASVEYGKAVGSGVLQWRANDGTKAPSKYQPTAGVGHWQRTFPDYYPPLLPQWPGVMPFAMDSADQFRPPAPPSLDSPVYADAVDQVMRLGALNSTERTADQTQIALYWADGGGTFTPPGHWNQIASDVALVRNATFSANVRTLAMLNVALADAGINCWDAKYHYDLWRPIDAIRRAAEDGNDATQGDTDWIPLLRTPPFPSYTSGHSTFSGAAAEVLTAVYGDHVAFRSEADGHQGFSQRPLDPSVVSTRSFESFWEAAEEASISRIYGGIHFIFDSHEGLNAGREIARVVVERFAK